jgi:CheY-like chemotaxis protein
MPTILVVDDSAVDRRLVGGFLQKKAVCTVEYAANGTEALAMMKDAEPDLIITDLTMPEMNGLELVTALRVHHPDVPVILMTAHGSEALALEALEKGAASYVPKSQLADRLAKTMEEVLSISQADRSHQQLIGCLERTEFTFSLHNDPALIDPLIELIQQMVTGMGLCDFTGRLRIGVALKEALLNALFHGNLEIGMAPSEDGEDTLIEEKDVSLVEQRRNEAPYRDRQIHVNVKLSKDQARFVVRDEGPGFDVSAAPHPSDPDALDPDRGRGLSLMQNFMDDTTFNETGNEVTMVRRRDNK